MIAMLNKMASKPRRVYNASCVHVQGSLAVTPAEMSQMADKGIPIASQLLDESQFYDGDTGRQVFLPNYYRRGYDITQAWNDQKDSRKRISDSRKALRGYEFQSSATE